MIKKLNYFLHISLDFFTSYVPADSRFVESFIYYKSHQYTEGGDVFMNGYEYLRMKNKTICDTLFLFKFN